MEIGPFLPEWMAWVGDAGPGVAAAAILAIPLTAALARTFEAVFDLDPS